MYCYLTALIQICDCISLLTGSREHVEYIEHPIKSPDINNWGKDAGNALLEESFTITLDKVSLSSLAYT